MFCVTDFFLCRGDQAGWQDKRKIQKIYQLANFCHGFQGHGFGLCCMESIALFVCWHFHQWRFALQLANETQGSHHGIFLFELLNCGIIHKRFL
jgi:hypothetical protein